jgi:phosphate starvation-inducible membrane PsiE
LVDCWLWWQFDEEKELLVIGCFWFVVAVTATTMITSRMMMTTAAVSLLPTLTLALPCLFIYFCLFRLIIVYFALGFAG